ncbi:MAG: DUF4907 domain-containing protein [Candidatus Kapabacteria bacterium]|nr:DUF4907 domain-containing protein [Candidatus Kapabacteria bacterium]
MKNLILIIVILSLSIAISFGKVKSKTSKIVKVDDKFSYSIINSSGGSFGYDILSSGKVMIHQENIPAVPGNQGFKEKKHAEAVAKFVIYKLKNNIMPPSVTPSEIDSLKAIK